MPATSSMLVREGQTNLAPFSPPDLSLAHTQWLLELSARLDRLHSARDHSLDLDVGGTTSMDSDLVAPLEEMVDEARRMVCALGGEMRRRSEGSLPVWHGVDSVSGSGSGSASGLGSSTNVYAISSAAAQAQTHTLQPGSVNGGMTRVASART